MIRLLVVLVAIVVLLAGAAFAQMPGGTVALFADPYGADCNLWDVVPALVNVYVVHIWHGGATTVQFSAPNPPCSQMTYLSDTQVMPMTLGNSQTGVSIGYGGCRPAPTHVLTINYFSMALTGPCCRYPVLPDPTVASGQIEVSDCMYILNYATGGRAIINSDQTCPCNYPVPVEETTWGQIKALYQ